MDTAVTEITINGVQYVPKLGHQAQPVPCYNNDGLKYVIVRCDRAGVFAGYLFVHKSTEATLYNARRIWYWEGAASLSQLAMEGTKKPSSCKFPCAVGRIELTGVLEVIDCTEAARKSIESVKEWKV